MDPQKSPRHKGGFIDKYKKLPRILSALIVIEEISIVTAALYAIGTQINQELGLHGQLLATLQEGKVRTSRLHKTRGWGLDFVASLATDQAVAGDAGTKPLFCGTFYIRQVELPHVSEHVQDVLGNHT